MKTCKQCGEEKSLDDFFRNKRLPGGYWHICKDCYRFRYRSLKGESPQHRIYRKQKIENERLEGLIAYCQYNLCSNGGKFVRGTGVIDEKNNLIFCSEKCKNLFVMPPDVEEEKDIYASPNPAVTASISIERRNYGK